MNRLSRTAAIALAPAACTLSVVFASCAESNDSALEINETTQGISEYDGGLRLPNYAQIPAQDNPDWGRVAFLTDGGSSDVPDGSAWEKPLGMWMVDKNNEWQHVGTGMRVFNVLDFGAYGKYADSDGSIDADDTGPIQRSIDAAAASSHGGIVYIPAGTYSVRGTLHIPRMAHKSIILQGAGMAATVLKDNGHITIGDPMIDFVSVSGAAIGYEINDMRLSREGQYPDGGAPVNDVGPLIHHASTGDGERFIHSSLKNLHLELPAPSDYSNESDVVVIEGGLNCIVENLRISGGRYALTLEDSSHCLVRNIRQDQYSQHGVRLLASGSSVLSMIRTENINGAALTIETKAGLKNGSIIVDGLFNEGKRTTHVLKIVGHDSSATLENIQVRQLGIAEPCATSGCGGAAERYGLYVNAHVRELRVTGGTLAEWGANTGYPIFIGAARDVVVEGLHSREAPGQDSIDSVYIHPDAVRTRVSFSDRDFNPYARQVGTAGRFAECGSACNWVGVAFTLGYDTLIAHPVATTAGDVITKIVYAGYHNGTQLTDVETGRVITIIAGAAPGVSEKRAILQDKAISGGNVDLSTSHWNDGVDPSTVIRLVFDGANWRELERL